MMLEVILNIIPDCLVTKSKYQQPARTYPADNDRRS